MPSLAGIRGTMAKVGVISDIHANLSALEEALAILDGEGVGEIFVCGDVVGYGNHPNECCTLLRALRCPVIAGNHDWAVAGRTEYAQSFSDRARLGVERTKEVIEEGHRDWLGSLPLHLEHNGIEFVHSTLVDPAAWRYPMLGKPPEDSPFEDVRESFVAMRGRLCFVGHSHQPALFLESRTKQVTVLGSDRPVYHLRGRRAIADVGSVGGPRNREGRSSLAVYDEAADEVRFVHFHASRSR